MPGRHSKAGAAPGDYINRLAGMKVFAEEEMYRNIATVIPGKVIRAASARRLAIVLVFESGCVRPTNAEIKAG